eukprot:1444312-Pleurochrysis_carterae.AAC.1
MAPRGSRVGTKTSPPRPRPRKPASGSQTPGPGQQLASAFRSQSTPNLHQKEVGATSSNEAAQRA